MTISKTQAETIFAGDRRALVQAGKVSLQTEDGWKAEWEASPKLQDEFPTAASYVATMKHDAWKSEPIANSGAPAQADKASLDTETRWKAEWEASPKLQEEFPTAASYVAIKKREAR